MTSGEGDYTQRFQAQLAAFDQAPSNARRSLREMWVADPKKFCLAVVPLLREGAASSAVSYLYDLLSSNGMLPFCDPSLLSLEDDIKIARIVMEKESLLDVKLAHRITGSGHGSNQIKPAVALRILEVLEVISDGARILPLLIQVLREPDLRLRSKAALLVGRINKSAQWAEQLLKEPDARVRANSIEALWDVQTEAVRGLLWTAARDPSNRVQGNALFGLYQLGEAAVVKPVLEMSKHASPAFRATAAWVMGQTEDPRFSVALAGMVRETDSVARHSVFRAIAKIKQAVARYRDLPPLQVSLCQEWPDGDGSRRLRAAIALPDGSDLPALPATKVALWEGRRIVTSYKLQQSHPPDWLALGVALPAKRTCPQDIEATLEGAVQSCLTIKGSAERWNILRFGARNLQNPDEPEFGAPPAGFLTAENDALGAALNNLENRYLYPDTLQALLSTVGSAAGSRHLLILDDRSGRSTPPEIHPARWTAIIRDAQAASVTIHAVALVPPGGSPGILYDVACQTGGMCLTTADPEKLAAICTKVHFGLLHPYEMVFRSERQDGEALKLQVYAPEGYGEDTLIP